MEAVEQLGRALVAVDLRANRGEVRGGLLGRQRLRRVGHGGRVLAPGPVRPRSCPGARLSSAHPSRRTFVAEVEAHITGTVWKIECEVGDQVEEGDTVVILESMKMEMPVEAEDAGVVREILCEEGQAVNEGDTLVVLE
jgi:acetyl-CoA carboxylase biotin carboxyl carrier protein